MEVTWLIFFLFLLLLPENLGLVFSFQLPEGFFSAGSWHSWVFCSDSWLTLRSEQRPEAVRAAVRECLLEQRPAACR